VSVGESVYIKDEKEGWKKSNEKMDRVLIEACFYKNLLKELEDYKNVFGCHTSVG